MAKLIIMVRVKDNVRFVSQWLTRYEQLADEIIVSDNGSTDGTYQIVSQHPQVVKVIKTEGYNEGRDKILMYACARERGADWCMWLDVDEIIEPAFTRARIDQMMDNKFIDRYVFRRFHFIDEKHFAGSAYWLNYSAGHDRMLWRDKSTGYFLDMIIDTPNIKGINGIKAYTNIRIKHLGYMDKILVDQKARIYRELKPDAEIAINAMYLCDTRKVKWHDNKNNIKVILLNTLLNILLFHQLSNKLGKKSWGFINKHMG